MKTDPAGGDKQLPTIPASKSTPYKHINPLTAGVAYIRVFNFYWHVKYHVLNMLKISCAINQQDLKRVDLHFVKSE